MSRFNQLNTTSKALAALAALLATALVGFLVFAAASAPAHAKPARQTATTDNGVSTAESEYAANSYDGAAAPDSVRFIDHTATSNLLIVAPHAVNHVRAGQPKEADMYTGGIAEMVAQKTGASVLTTTGKVSDWGDNWDTRDDEFTRILRSIPTNVRVLDLHGMADGYGIDESIGLGPRPTSADQSQANRINKSFGSSSAINGAGFAATSSYTITSFMQKRGHVALQLELSRTERERNSVVNDVATAITK